MGQLFFSSYEPFLKEGLTEETREPFDHYMALLDHLPELPLRSEEISLLESLSEGISMEDLQKVNLPRRDLLL